MAVRVKRYSQNGIGDPTPRLDSTFEQRETTVDGYTFHWGLNQHRNFLDDGIGAAHAAFNPGTNVVLDPIPFGSAQS